VFVKIDQPLTVSVIVPLYNKAAYIERTLRSIAAQTVQPTEIIVVNDGSTDESPAIVQRFIDTNAVGSIHLVNQPNLGPGAARNRGLSLATGKYISFLDADDEWLPTFLETSLQNLSDHPECVLSVTGQRRGVPPTDWTTMVKQMGLSDGLWRLPTDLPPEAHKPNLDVMHSGAIVCDRSIMQKFGGFYAKDHCTYGEDLYLWLQILLHYPIYRDWQPLMWYHTEASDLAVWQRQHCPPWPMLLDPEPIRAHCPPPYQPLLETLLANYAVMAAYRSATQGNRVLAQQLLQQFPKTRDFGPQRRRIDLELLISSIPYLRTSLRHLKRWLKRWLKG
jgi:Glycosyl transferase family 2